MLKIRRVRVKVAKVKVEAHKVCSWVLRIMRLPMCLVALNTLLLFQLLESCTLGVSILKDSWDSATMKIEVGPRWSRTYHQASWKVGRLMRQLMGCKTHQRDQSRERLVMELAVRRHESSRRHKQSRKVDLQEHEAFLMPLRNQVNQWIWRVARTTWEVMEAIQTMDLPVYRRMTMKYWGSSTRWPKNF